MVISNLPKKYQLIVESAIKELFSRQILPYLYFRFSFTKKITELGYCFVDSDDKAREFSIVINVNQPENEIIITILHELVHCKQFCYGELSLDGLYWKNKKINRSPHSIPPWEVEAEDQSLRLFGALNEHI